MVGGKDDIGVGGGGGRFEGIEKAANLRIHIRDVGVIFGAVKLNGGAGAGEWGEEFVADAVVALIEGVLGEIAGRNLNFVRWVAFDEIARGLTGIVRGVEADVHEKRLAGGGFGLQVLNGAVDPKGSGVADLALRAVQPLAIASGVPRGPGVAGAGTIVCVGAGFEHAAGDDAGLSEAAFEGSVAEVPFANEEGVVAGSRERFRPERRLLEFLAGAKSGQAGIEHGAAGNADGGGPGALVEAVGEVSAALDETVDIWGLDFGVA